MNEGKNLTILFALVMMTFITDQQNMSAKRQIPADMTGKRISGRIYDVDHHPACRIVLYSTTVKSRSPFLGWCIMQQCFLPLSGKRNRRNHHLHLKIRVFLPQSGKSGQGKNSFSCSGDHIYNASVLIFLPRLQTGFLPWIKLHQNLTLSVPVLSSAVILLVHGSFCYNHLIIVTLNLQRPRITTLLLKNMLLHLSFQTSILKKNIVITYIVKETAHNEL